MPNTDLNKPALFSREFALVSTISFLISVNFFTLLATIPKYAIEIFGMSETQAGFASGLFVCGMLASRLVAGRFVNRIGFRPMLLLGITGLVVFSAGYLIAMTPLLLFIVRFFNGFAFGLTSNTNITIISSIIPRERSGEGIGYYSVFQALAWGVGPYFGVTFLESGNTTALFLFCMILPGAGFAIIPFLRLPAIPKSPAPPADAKKGVRLDRYFERSVITIALSTFIITLFFPTVTGFAAVYAMTIGVSDISYFFIVFTIATIATRPLISKMIDRFGPGSVLYPGCAMGIAAYILFSRVSSLNEVLVIGALFGIGMGVVHPATLSLAVRRSPRDRLGVTNATYYIFLDGSASAGPVIGGLFIELFGYSNMFLAGAAVTVAGLIYYRKFVPRDERIPT